MGYINDPAVIKVNPTGAVQDELDAHKAEKATVADDVHGLVSGGRVIEESGSNSNGRYVRFSDGTQICRLNKIVLTFSGVDHLETSWIFPAPFIEMPVISASRKTDISDWNATPTRREVTEVHGGTFGSFSQCTVRIWTIKGMTGFVSGDTVNAQAFAVGRWK